METSRCRWIPNLILLIGLMVSTAVSTRLPTHWGWENGPLEQTQVVILLAGLAVAVWAARRQSGSAFGYVWRIAAFFWLAMAAREMGWGATWLPAYDFDPLEGPLYSSRHLWWKPAVPWVCGLLLLISAYWVVRHRIIGSVIWFWMQRRRFPWATLAMFVLAMLVSAVAEGHAGVDWISGVVPEEMAECWAYLALWWAQWCLIHASLPVPRYSVQLR